MIAIHWSRHAYSTLYTSIQSQESGDGQQFKKSAVRWQLHHFTHFDLQGPVIGRKEHSSLTSQ